MSDMHIYERLLRIYEVLELILKPQIQGCEANTWSFARPCEIPLQTTVRQSIHKVYCARRARRSKRRHFFFFVEEKVTLVYFFIVKEKIDRPEVIVATFCNFQATQKL